MKERCLDGQTGMYVDSWIASSYFPDYIEYYGGKGLISEFVPEDFDELVESNNLNFLIVHNYRLEDLDMLLHACNKGVKVLLLKKSIVPPQLEQEYETMHNALTQAGAEVERVSFRNESIKKFLEKNYGEV